MISFSGFLSEEKNVHMEHLEDLVLNGGVEGTKQALDFLIALKYMMSGRTKSSINRTVKWDGAPAIFAGIDPSDGKFFVAKKGVFNVQPLTYKSQGQIRSAKELSPALKRKFAVAFREFSKLGITGVIQGDLLFTKSDLKKTKIDGREYITFHPNTIVYAVPEGSDLSAKILGSKIGVIWHTKYTGNRLADMKADFKSDIIKGLTKTKNVFMDDASYKDVSGQATFTESETKELNELLSVIGRKFRSVGADILNTLAENEELKIRVKAFINSKIKEGEVLSDPKSFVKEMIPALLDYYDKQIEAKKTERGKEPQREKKKVVSKLSTRYSELVDVFEIYQHIQLAKMLIVRKMDQAKTVGTFLKTADGYEITTPEGYVAIDRMGSAVKLVDRLEFSRANFDPKFIKGWQR